MLIELESFLKLSESVKITLAPASDLYSDKKGFKWVIQQYSEDGLAIKVIFDHPEFITTNGIDTLKI